MATLTENVKRVTDALDDIKSSIIAKGQTPTGNCETFADAIDKISSGGTDVSDTTATPNAVIENEVFYDKDGKKQNGTIILLDNSAYGTHFDLGRVEDTSTLSDGYLEFNAPPKRVALESSSTGRLYLPTDFTLGDADDDSVLDDVTFSSMYGVKRNGTIPKKLGEEIIVEAGSTQPLERGYYKNCTITALSTGKKCVSGKFDTVASQDVYVECGFEPSMIMVSSISAKGTIASTDTSVYVKNATLEKHSFYRTSSVGQETNANANLRFTVDSNGFYYRSRYTNSDVYYMAIE